MTSLVPLQVETMTSLESYLVDQAFLPYQFETALAPIFWFGLCAADACYDRCKICFAHWKEASTSSLFLAVFTMLALFPQGSFPHMASLAIRLYFSGGNSYMAIFNPPPSWDREAKAMFWILIDPLGWIVELAIFFQLDYPILPAELQNVNSFTRSKTLEIDFTLRKAHKSRRFWDLSETKLTITVVLDNKC